MKSNYILTCASIILFAYMSMHFYSCNSSKANPQSFTYYTLDVDAGDTSLTFKNLRIYPILAKAALTEQETGYGNYVSLDSAIKSKKISISEKSISANDNDDVNKLFMKNESDDTLYLMAGEIVKGGNQDRTLAKDVVLPPGKRQYDVSVFCVEHGRWSSNDEYAANQQAPQAKQFMTCSPIVKASVRKEAVVTKKQEMVWNKVADANAKSNNVTSTSAYTSIDHNVDYQKSEKEYRSFFESKLRPLKNVVGFAAVSGNKIIGCDIFCKSSLFTQSISRILPSYINEAIHDGAKVNIKESDVKKYLDQLLRNDKTQKDYLAKNGKMYTVNGKILHLTAY